MEAKKSLCFLMGLFVITVWIWGFAAPALSETLIELRKSNGTKL